MGVSADIFYIGAHFPVAVIHMPNIYRNIPTPAPTRPAKQCTYADDPFKSAFADLILRTSDWVEFRAHRDILVMSSSSEEAVLEIMQSSADGPMSTATMRDHKGRSIIHLTEDSVTLDALLRLIYPVDDPPIRDVRVAFSVLEAARKYQMVLAIKAMKRVVAQFAHVNPARVYVLATERRWAEEMKTSAKAALGRDIQKEFAPEFRGQPFEVYEGLLKYQRCCAEAAASRIRDLTWMETIARREGWRPCWATCHNIPACRESFAAHPGWFDRYLSTVFDILRANPRGNALDYQALMPTALVEAFGCIQCKQSVAADLLKFNTLLAKKVEQIVEEMVSFFLHLLCSSNSIPIGTRVHHLANSIDPTLSTI